MDGTRLKRVMELEDKRVVDIASELRIAPDTVRKVLRGESVSRLVSDKIKSYLDGKASTATAKAATG
jgi:hypothetical protein